MAGRSTGSLTVHSVLPLLFVVAGCTLVYLMPDISRVLVYDRQRFLSGDWWRLLTGHAVHFTPEHLCSNLLGFVVAGGVVQLRKYAGLWKLCAVSALAISGGLLIQADMASFGGLSGIVNAVIVYAATRGIGEQGVWRRISIVVLILTIGNSLLEAMTMKPTFAIADRQSFVPVPLSHVIGGLTGGGMGLLSSQREEIFSNQ